MSKKHTPGPWSVSSLDDTWEAPYRNDGKTSSISTVVNADGETVALPVAAYDEWSNPGKDAELDANARLIAAAPDLLDALQMLVDLMPDPELDIDTVQREQVIKAKAVIAKATNPD